MSPCCDLVEGAVSANDHAVHGLDGLLASDFARCVSAHAVCDDVESKLVVDEEGIFVQLSALADVGQSRTVILQIVPSSSGGRCPAPAFPG